MINLKEYKDTKAIIELLTECMYPDQERVLREFEAYQSNECRRLLGIVENDELVGLIGVIALDDSQVELKHIAVKSSHRRQGLGKRMITTYMEDSPFSIMKAETDQDAVQFYKKIGCNIISLGEKYPGVERFECIFSKAGLSGSL